MKKLIIVFFISFPGFVFTQKPAAPNKLYPILYNYARDLYPEYSNIPFERKMILEEIANYIIGSKQINNTGIIKFIETNHSTRSILAHVWATAATHYYGIENVKIFSGGINHSHISINAILALEKAGFIVYKISSNNNPAYEIKYTYDAKPLILTSKKYNDKSNPDNNFGSIILCPNADINLPVVIGNNFRTSLYYDDPAAYDESPEALNKYLTKSNEIATEMFYLFYLIKNSN